MPRPPGRDRLRELLDAVLDDDASTLVEMARGARASPFHLSHRVTSLAGESPVAMRRRVELERAAWHLRRGVPVAEVASGAGYASVEGFSRAFARAFARPPSAVGAADGFRVPAANGIHFHPPVSLWLDAPPGGDGGIGAVTLLLVDQDLDDVALLLDAAATLDDDVLAAPWCPTPTLPSFAGEERCLLDVLRGLVATKDAWLAAVVGTEAPPAATSAGVDDLRARHERVATAWRGTVAAVERRGGWGDRVVDALCEPPQSFTLAGILAHVLTFSVHRRQLARGRLRELGALPTPASPSDDDADPLTWLDRRHGGPA